MEYNVCKGYALGVAVKEFPDVCGVFLLVLSTVRSGWTHWQWTEMGLKKRERRCNFLHFIGANYSGYDTR